MQFVREGYWIRKSLDGEVLAVYRADPNYHDFVYNTELKTWVELDNPINALGVSDDYDKTTEQEALVALGIESW